MIRKYSLISTFVAALMLSASASAVDYRARAGLGVGDYELEIEFDDGLDNEFKDTSTLVPFVFGATAVFDSFYVDLEFRTSDTSAKEADDLKRTDLNLTVGFPVSDRVVVFAGIKSGDSEFEEKALGGSITTSFESEGVFGGAAYSMPVADNQTVSLSGGLAILDAKLEIETGGVKAEEDADISLGLSLGVLHNIALNESWNVGTSLKYQIYWMNFDDEGFGAELDVTETMLMLGVTLGYSF